MPRLNFAFLFKEYRPWIVVVLATLIVAQGPAGVAAAATAEERPDVSKPKMGDCAGVSTGLAPLPDLHSGLYRGYPGGLYPDGRNVPPEAYLREGMQRAGEIQPRNEAGAPDPSGKIGLLSIGMSNTTQEFRAFINLVRNLGRRARSDVGSKVNPALVLVDGAQGGQDALKVSDPSGSFWSVVDRRLQAAGLTREQVQVVWVKEAIARESHAFPHDALRLEEALARIVDLLEARFPNLQIVYFSSRTYAGYATSTLNPEPHAYHSGFAVKWLIEKRIRGERGGPWLAWGPYLWTDGMAGRSDGFTWECGDSAADGTHPSQTGKEKVAQLLFEFFTTAPTARSWFLDPRGE